MARQTVSTTFQTSRKAKKFLNINQTIQEFSRAADLRELDAIKLATTESRTVFTSNLSGRPFAPARPGRPTTGGNFASYIEWIKAPGSKDVSISLDYSRLKSVGSYALINEIGTGRSANILNPAGTITIPSQVGRTLPRGLIWADGPGAQATGPETGNRSQQLFARTDVNGGYVAKGRVGRIRREIKGKHFIRDGGALGFRTLDAGLRADVKRIFQ